jgi:uncharacterized coiled-coil protein SlyX
MNTKSVALTETRNARWMFGIIGLLVALGLTAGCATSGQMKKTQADVAALQETLTRHETGIMNTATAVRRVGEQVKDNAVYVDTQVGLLLGASKANTAAIKDNAVYVDTQVGLLLGASKANTAAIKEIAERTTANTGSVDLLKSRANDVDGRLTKMDSALGAQATAITGTKQEVAKVKATANTVASKATALTRRVGLVETTHYDHAGKKAVMLYFPTAKLAADGSFAACAEIMSAAKAAIADHILLALKDGKVAWQISGFADSRPFLDAKGKPLGNSDELNASCAQARADAVYMHLVGAKAGGIDNVKVVPMGKTMRFGKHDADRSVVVELITP